MITRALLQGAAAARRALHLNKLLRVYVHKSDVHDQDDHNDFFWHLVLSCFNI